MEAAAHGKSTLGISAKVGKEFAKADRGGKLPAKVEDGEKTRADRRYRKRD